MQPVWLKQGWALEPSVRGVADAARHLHGSGIAAGGDEFKFSTAVENWNPVDPGHESAKDMSFEVQPDNVTFCRTDCAAVNATTGGRKRSEHGKEAL
jgi:hypothetical protein